MARTTAFFLGSIALALQACSSSPSPAPTLNVGNGLGSELGNYGGQIDGEMRGPSGERCVLFNWDRPLNRNFALRYRSASCESQERPGRMICLELSRAIIPMSESHLKNERWDAGE